MTSARETRGFTLIEVLMVAVIVSILAGLGMPNLQRALLKARAADAIGDLHVIRVAAFQHYAEHGDWPPDVGRGRMPNGLADFMPEGFSFRQDDYVLDWDDWSGRSRGFVGVTVITREKELGDAIVSLLGDGATWTDGRRKFSWVIDWD